MFQKITRLGLVSALHQEQAGLIEAMQNPQTVSRGMRDYVAGNLWGMDTVCVLSRIGKVAAAATVATLIERFDVSHIVFTGVAGAVESDVQVGDIVVADSLAQYDMDATPLFPRFEVPLLGQSLFASDKHLTDRLTDAAGLARGGNGRRRRGPSLFRVRRAVRCDPDDLGWRERGIPARFHAVHRKRGIALRFRRHQEDV